MTKFFIAPITFCLLILGPGASDSRAQTTAAACSADIDCFGFADEPGGERLCGVAGTDFDLLGTDAGDRLCGLTGDDQVSGGPGPDLVNGNQGNDLVKGNQGDDVVRGGQGNDEVRGGIGEDFVYGDDGNDDLWGDRGDDHLFGGPGADVFHYRKGDGDDIVDDTLGPNTLVAHELEPLHISTWQEGFDCLVSVDAEDVYGSVLFLNQNCNALRIVVVGGPCVPDQTTLCLQDGRFQVESSWRNFEGDSGPGRVVPVESTDSGLFWFFDSNNWEMLVKVLDGCAFNGHYWVFSAATTDVEFSMTVTDLTSGRVARYSNELGVASPANNDSFALATCP